MLYKKGLAYQAEALVNYDPVDRTVLANEQVDNNGRSWRSGAIVEQRMLRQWFFKITEFQKSLLDDLDCLAEHNRWPDRVIQQQRHWIGRSKGATVTFEVNLGGGHTPVNVFTTRPDTLFGVEYLALSLSHPIVQDLAKSDTELATFVSRRASFGPDSKAGFELPIDAVHPAARLSPDVPQTIPVFVAPYVLDNYGEGAVMGVPAHDTRDFSFWKLNKPGTPMSVVIAPPNEDGAVSETELQEAYTEVGTLTHLCGPYAGMSSQSAATRIVQDLTDHGAGSEKETWRLRDWLISRQRYWGTPIPIIHCNSCGAVPVPDEQLPVSLPELGDMIQGQKGNPLDSIESFVECECPSCGRPARRETDTMDTFVDSSWYYARFPDSQNENQLFSPETAAKMLPVDIYVGGVEHAILHLLYARFIYKFLCQEGLLPTSDNALSKEPFSRLVAQGMVHGKTFSDPDTGKFLKPEELILQDERGTPLVKTTGKQANVTWEKMSKSKHNGVDPISCFQKYGADVTRAHMLFAAPLSEVLQWDEAKIIGIQRWLYRVSRLLDDLLTQQSSTMNPNPNPPAQQQRDTITPLTDTEAHLLLLTNTTLHLITNTIETNIYNINTIISDLIKLTNAIHDHKISNLTPWLAHQIMQTLIKMLAPITPAFAEQCFEDMQQSTLPLAAAAASTIFTQSWPEPLLTPAEEATLHARRKTIVCAVQINGKLRFTTDVPAPPMDGKKLVKSPEHEERVVATVLGTEEGRLWLQERNEWEKRKRVVVVGGGKVLNIVF